MSRRGVPNKVSRKIEFKCRECGKCWNDYPSRLGRKKYCSKHCAALNKPQLYKKGNQINLGKKYSVERRLKISKANKIAWMNPNLRKKLSNERLGYKNPAWVENATNYSTIHKWLVNKYGNANKCEIDSCNKKYEIYQWAKIRDKLYQRKRENFMMLCISCHSIYDKERKQK